MLKQVQKGFTLIELMIVIAIIGILASVALPAYREYIITTNVASVISSTSAVKAAISENYSRQGENWIQDVPGRLTIPCAYDPEVGNHCWVTDYGLRAAPDAEKIDGIDEVSIETGIDPTGITETCTGFPLAVVTPGIPVNSITPAMSFQISFDGTLDNDLDGELLLTPVVDPVRPQNLGWVASTSGTLAAGEDMAGVACKWFHENLNADWM